jgi:hypothetical protein
MDPSRLLLEKVELVAVGTQTLVKARRRILSCERCNWRASMPFVLLLDSVTGRKRSATEYVLSGPVRCRNCTSPILETTLVLFETKTHEVFGEFVPSWHETDIVLVDAETVREAQELIVGCEHCSTDAEVSFDHLLDTITSCDPTVTEYVLYQTARCPNCSCEVTAKTLVVPE